MAASEMPGLVHQVIDEIWSRGDLALADHLFAPDYVNHGGLIPDLVHGPEAIKFAVVLYRRAFPRLRIAVEDLVVDGENVRFRWAMHNAIASSEEINPDTARQGTLAGGMVVRVVGGQIAESWMSWDREDALRRLGLDLTRAEGTAHFAA